MHTIMEHRKYDWKESERSHQLAFFLSFGSYKEKELQNNCVSQRVRLNFII